MRFSTLWSFVLTLGVALFAVTARADVTLLNVSYDPTREFYQEYNQAFARNWLAKTGEKAVIKQSHGGSGKQGRAVIDGLDADVVTLALASDINAIAEHAKLLPKDWQARLPNNSTPYTSTIVFLVRKGNPKGIKDWDDLAKPGVTVITPNPKTLGGAQWNYLAGLGNCQAQVRQRGQGEGVRHGAVPECPGARLRRARFHDDVRRARRGRCVACVENEAFLSLKEFGPDKFEIVAPSLSILAEPPVAVVTATSRKGTRKVAEAYLRYLYSDEGQEIAAPQASIALPIRRSPPSMQSSSRSYAGHDRRRVRRLAEYDGPTLPMAALSIQIYLSAGK